MEIFTLYVKLFENVELNVHSCMIESKEGKALTKLMLFDYVLWISYNVCHRF